jgi:hypothetical protein
MSTPEGDFMRLLSEETENQKGMRAPANQPRRLIRRNESWGLGLRLLATGVLMVSLAAPAMASSIEVLYWDGSQLNVIGPGSGYTIPAGAIYALDEVQWTGVELVLAAMPGTPSPDPATVPGPNVSVPSITTPSGVTFEIPDSGNVASIDQNGGSVTVTYVDGATATVPGTYVPPGSAPPPPAPPVEPDGPPAPPLNSGQQAAVANELLNDAWVQDFMGGKFKYVTPPQFGGSNTIGGTLYINTGQTDTIIQRITDNTKTPESDTGLYLLLGVAGWSGLMAFRVRGRLRIHASVRM